MTGTSNWFEAVTHTHTCSIEEGPASSILSLPHALLCCKNHEVVELLQPEISIYENVRGAAEYTKDDDGTVQPPPVLTMEEHMSSAGYLFVWFSASCKQMLRYVYYSFSTGSVLICNQYISVTHSNLMTMTPVMLTMLVPQVS